MATDAIHAHPFRSLSCRICKCSVGGIMMAHGYRRYKRTPLPLALLQDLPMCCIGRLYIMNG